MWPRLLENSEVLAEVARAALERCHFDPETGEDQWAEICGRACYDCLLSYTNQLDHPILDRHLVKDYLWALSRGQTLPETAGRAYEEQYRWLTERCDPASSLERDFLALLYRTRRRLPDRTQYRPEPEVYAEVDFYYDQDGGVRGTCVFCDGPGHDAPERAHKDQETRQMLRDLGYRVVVIRYDEELEEQVKQWPDVFGSSN